MKQYSLLLKKKLLFVILVLFLFIGILSACTLIVDNDSSIVNSDSSRGATTVKQDQFGDSYTTIKYLDQGWDITDSLWFYTTTMGSNLMPYDFFMVLEQIGKSELFRSDENMNFYRYLPQKASSNNPDALPVGWVKDEYKGKDYIGLTCAACHTGQVNYNGVGIRIDGGPAGADMESIMKDIARALIYTNENEEARARFVKNVLARGKYKTEPEVLADLKKFKQRIVNHVTINHSNVSYGYARTDTFGQIYNQVLEHLVNGKLLHELLIDRRILSDIVIKDKKLEEEDIEKLKQILGRFFTDSQRDHVVERFSQLLDARQLGKLRNTLFNMSNAPVSYPFLWDTPQHDYVQWNGSAPNAGLGAIGRNIEKVIGVFATLDWKENFSRFNEININFSSSVDIDHLQSIEFHLQKLQSPVWPEEILGLIDRSRASQGKKLFSEYCESCHDVINSADPNRRVIANIIRVSDVGSDPLMAENRISTVGYSGVLRNQYAGFAPGNVLLNRRAPVEALLSVATFNVLVTPDPDKSFIERWFYWFASVAKSYYSNSIPPTMKQGNYDSDTSGNPIASLNAYKARSLNGIWATAPYLHNGSVPTLYDLLLPKKREGDPDDGEYRPDQFEVGSREFDPIKVGFKSYGYKGFIFDSSLPGNSNAGHEYASGKTSQLNGKVLKPLSKEERLDLLEYLKTL